MNAFDIAVVVFISVAFVAVVAYMIWRKAKGKGGCDCGCDACPHCSHCGKKEKDEKKQ